MKAGRHTDTEPEPKDKDVLANRNEKRREKGEKQPWKQGNRLIVSLVNKDAAPTQANLKAVEKWVCWVARALSENTKDARLFQQCEQKLAVLGDMLGRDRPLEPRSVGWGRLRGGGPSPPNNSRGGLSADSP